MQRHTSSWYIRLVILVLTVVALLCPLVPTASANVFYRFDIIAQTGQASLISMGDSPSINDDGEVGFVGVLTGGQAVFIGNGVGNPVNITPGFVRSTLVFGRAVQINNNWKVVARDQVSGSPPSNFIRLWD